ncbi:hypothetical protein [Herbidospora cretacea]|uniref:hypothetical protein n=1 Tax=Herbidospora cretacea TaxID=28444 RepID=UPI0012F76EC3|nr:hypothetical protein [Herbidospora cretacea]
MGDWTPELVREWWPGRHTVVEFAEGLAEGYTKSDEEWERKQVPALRDYAVSIVNGELEAYLRGYVLWLVERRQPREGELPEPSENPLRS